jgi:dTDP-4-amino-4,6-dideoxygalactose transaminase
MKIEVYSPTIRRKEMDAVLTAMVEDKIGPGEQGRFLIQVAREQLQFDFCLALRSPAMALGMALRALQLEDGGGVVLSALSPRYYGRVLKELRLRPIFCDVLPGSVNMGPPVIEAALSRGEERLEPRAILVNHTLGFVPDMAAIAGMGFPVIEDCSRSYGTFVGEARAGSFGVFTILGLEERDILTSGGGALLYAQNRRDAAVLRGFSVLPEYSLPDLNAAMAAVQFREGKRNLEKRAEIARVYVQSALRTRHKRFVQQDNAEYNNYSFPLILESGMKDVRAYGKRKDIAVEAAFEDTLAGSPGVSELCPEAYSLSLRTALFPLYPRLGSAETEKVAKLILTLP